MDFEDIKWEEGSLGFYNSREIEGPNGKYYDNYSDYFGDRHILISNVMGGNYGIGSSYLVQKEDKLFIFTYYGDSSANISEVTDKIQVSDFLNNQEKQYKDLFTKKIDGF